jgi:DNA primase catalytic subunit
MAEESKSSVEAHQALNPILEAKESREDLAQSAHLAEPVKKKRRLSEKQIQALEKGRERRWLNKSAKKITPKKEETKASETKDEIEAECSSSSESESAERTLSPPSDSGSEPTSASEQSETSSDYTPSGSSDDTDSSDQSDSVDSYSSLESPPPSPPKLKRSKKHISERPPKNIKERVENYLAQYRFV